MGVEFWIVSVGVITAAGVLAASRRVRHDRNAIVAGLRATGRYLCTEVDGAIRFGHRGAVLELSKLGGWTLAVPVSAVGNVYAVVDGQLRRDEAGIASNVFDLHFVDAAAAIRVLDAAAAAIDLAAKLPPPSPPAPGQWTEPRAWTPPPSEESSSESKSSGSTSGSPVAVSAKR